MILLAPTDPTAFINPTPGPSPLAGGGVRARGSYMRSAFALLGGLMLAGCQNIIVGTQGAPQTVPVRIAGTPADATVTIDDQRVGSLQLVAARGMRVFAGRHRISVESAGYLPWDQVIEAKDEPVRLDVKLVPIPD